MWIHSSERGDVKLMICLNFSKGIAKLIQNNLRILTSSKPVAGKIKSEDVTAEAWLRRAAQFDLEALRPYDAVAFGATYLV